MRLQKPSKSHPIPIDSSKGAPKVPDVRKRFPEKYEARNRPKPLKARRLTRPAARLGDAAPVGLDGGPSPGFNIDVALQHFGYGPVEFLVSLRRPANGI
jgi:hypothetical protein